MMRLLYKATFGFMVMSCCVGSSSDGQVAVGTIVDSIGRPVPGAEARLISPNGLTTVSTERMRRGTTAFGLSAPPPDERYVMYYLAACAEGFAPQVVVAPFSRSDTLAVAFELHRTTARSINPLGSGACNWRQDYQTHVDIKRNGSFASDAARLAQQIEAFAVAQPRDTAAARAYTARVVARSDSILLTARTEDAKARAAYAMIAPLRSYAGPDTADVRARILRALPPNSRWWTSQMGIVQSAVATLFGALSSGDRTRQATATRARIETYLEKMALIGEPEIRDEARGELVRYVFASGDSVRGRQLLTALLKDQPDYAWSKLVAAHYGNSSLRTGARMPQFAFAPLPDTAARHITNSDLTSRLTLIEFWGTWCGPCVAEIPALTRLYSRLHSSGLEILSVAADASPATVNKFRRRRYKMPWLNAYGGNTQAPTLQSIGVVTYPTAVLVDSTGTIVASGEMLSPARLDQTVNSFFPQRK
jgi:thiol-disulfide isomerase/thioredoxin